MTRQDQPMFTPAAPSRLFIDTMRLAAAAAVLGAALGLLPLGMSAALGAEDSHIRISGQSFGSTQRVIVDVNKSMIIDLPIDAAEVIVSQPGVANAILRSKRRAIIQANGSGETNIFFLDAAGRTIVVLDVSTKGSASPAGESIVAVLRDTYAKVIPSSRIDVEAIAVTNTDGQTSNRIVLSGEASSAADASKALSIAGQFAGSLDNVTSVMNVSGSQQVMLKVTVAEVKRDVAKQLGINLSSTFSIGGIGGSFNSTTIPAASTTIEGSPNGVSTTLPVNMPFGSASVDVAVQALESQGAIRMLAEPVLTALSGERADFHAGGEVRYATGTDENGNTVYETREYGVTLGFTPVIKSGGVVGLAVQSKVSEPQSDTTLNKREISTSVELGVGQTLSIAGLLDDRVRQEISRMPGLGDMPILGALFRSREYVRSQTELVFLVTPYLAQPIDGRAALPTDRNQLAGDAEAIFLGHIESVYGVGPAGTRGGYDGNVGFLLD